MAKQRRARPRPGPSKPARSAPRAAPRPGPSARSARPSDRPAAPVTRAGYLEAVALYEKALSALQAHESARASSLLRSVLANYPEEKELHERVRLYLNICERQATPKEAAPQ